MKEQRVSVTMKDVQRYRVLKDVLDKRTKAVEASRVLNLSYVHILRLKAKIAKSGLGGLLRPYRKAHNKISDPKAKIITALYKEHYSDFNIMHFKDKLSEVHNISLSYESIRQILIRAKCHIPKKKKLVHRRRRRMPKAGMLVQMDSSQHRWLETIPQKWWLVAMIDDATNEVPYVRLYPSDTVFANMHVIRRFVELKGIFMCLYVDRASHFKGPRHKEAPHYRNEKEQTYSHIERALDELDINIISATSCQAKGRIERLFGFFQDRLIKEMKLAGIRNYTQANRFLLTKFLPWYNKRYTHKAESVYMPLPEDKDLDTIFCIKKERVVNHDNTVQVDGQVIQIPPTDIRLSFAKAKVDVCILEDGRILVLYKDQIIAESKVSKKNKLIKQYKEQEFLSSKELVACHA